MKAKPSRFLLMALLGLVLGLLLATAVSAAGGKSAPITLGLGQTRVVPWANTAIYFADVPEDSRCPTNEVCIWPGAVTVSLLVWSTAPTSIKPFPESVTLRLDPTRPEDATAELSSGRRLTLLWVE
ncbi:MAG: hypothetical protein ACREUU_20990, partial [Gammaproteobacteria bacterium]